MLPELFLKRMEAQLGPEFPDYLASLERPRAVALRLNPQKGDIPALPFVKSPVPWEPLGYYYDPEARPGLHPFHDAGVYYLQEASAMAPAVLLDPKPGDRILDLCAAPGGKTTQIAGKMGGKGLLVCNEIHPKRAKILSQNVERMAIANALVLNEAPAALAQRFPGFFDRILVDAPCSGEGMFRKEAAAVADWSPELVDMCARRQGEILDAAAKMLRPGGRLVYSTCTFAPQEDEEAVAAFLSRHQDFAPETVEAPWFTPGENGAFRLWPHKLLGEGHFAAVLRRMDGNEKTPSRAPGERLPEGWLRFSKEQGISLPAGKAVRFGDTLFWAPEELPDLGRLRVLRPGLELGTLKKDRLEPAHALALWLRPREGDCKLSPDSPALSGYLWGQTIPGTERGYRLVCAGDYSLGWAKGDGQMLKNHYPKGLRRGRM